MTDITPFFRPHRNCRLEIGSDSLMRWHHPFRTINLHNFRMNGFTRLISGPARSTPGMLFARTGPAFAIGSLRNTVPIVPTSFHPKATAELEESAAWYAERSSAASRSFCEAIDASLAKIEADPERFPPIDRAFSVSNHLSARCRPHPRGCSRACETSPRFLAHSMIRHTSRSLTYDLLPKPFRSSD
jgi:hypothetical protein